MGVAGYGRCPVCDGWAYTVKSPIGLSIAVHWTAGTTERTPATRCRGTSQDPVEARPL